jgi:hypothetical protein
MLPVVALLLVVAAVGAELAGAQPRMGMNLAGPADWATELPFVDVFRFSRPWISQGAGAEWGKGPALDLDKHGWVTRLAPGCRAETFLCTIDGGHYPQGDYTVLYDGEGEIVFAQAASVVSSAPGRMVIHVEPRKGGIDLQLVATTPGNYVRNIRVIMPGFEKTYRENPWHPVFLRRWKGMACLRFMDFMDTNDSRQRKWSDRPREDDATYSEKGIPVELLVDLCNRQHCDGWFCIPHLADDEYVERFATVVKERLAPGLKAWVEYSNEVWNGGFSQNGYAGQQGQKLGFSEKPWEAAWKYTAFRSVQIFSIWEKVFGDRRRLVRVLAAQAANSYVAGQILSFQDAGHQADALAIAPYFGFAVPGDRAEKINESVVENWNVDQVLDHIESVTLPESVRWIKSNKAVADQYGLKLVAYEAGQHLVGIGGAENNDHLTSLLHAANQAPRMGKIYGEYLAAWSAAGGDLLCNFSSVSAWSKWGNWGLLQYFDDDDESASPKFAAVKRWASEHGQSAAATYPAEEIRN